MGPPFLVDLGIASAWGKLHQGLGSNQSIMASLHIRGRVRGGLALGVSWASAGANAVVPFSSGRFLVSAVADALLPRARRRPDGAFRVRRTFGLAVLVVDVRFV